MSFEILNLQQDTKEWHDWRSGGLGSSDAPIITGKSPWKTAYELWEEKTGIKKSENKVNSAMQRGKDLEQSVRERVENFTKKRFQPLCATSKKHKFANASVDGLSEDKSLTLEIKCPNKEDHEYAKQSGMAPEKYMDQIRHIQLVTKTDTLYASYHNAELVLREIKYDETQVKELLEKEKEFWKCVQKEEPPELSERDYLDVTSSESKKLAESYIHTQEKIKQLEEYLQSLKEQLQIIPAARFMIKAGDKLLTSQEVFRKGNVQYAKIPELKNVNLEIYRGKPSVYKMFKVKEQK